MANLKDLKIRISSVKSTQKITKAMQMVAASKLRRAQERAEAARPYTEKMERMLATLASEADMNNAPALLGGHRADNGDLKDGIHLLIVATSDRGLCGGFNSSIVKEAKRKIANLHGDSKLVKLVIIGKKGFEQLRSGYEKDVIHKASAAKGKQAEYSESEDIAERVILMFEKGEIDACSIIYNKFINPLEQIVTVQQLIPLDVPITDATKKSDKVDNNSIYEYEPDEEQVLSDLLPRNLAVQIFHSILENSASEQGSRMTAMDNATRNAGDMIDKLSLIYNRTRQAAITTELTEIVAGAEAV